MAGALASINSAMRRSRPSRRLRGQPLNSANAFAASCAVWFTSASEVQKYSGSSLEPVAGLMAGTGWPAGRARLWPMIETPASFMPQEFQSRIGTDVTDEVVRIKLAQQSADFTSISIPNKSAMGSAHFRRKGDAAD